MLHSNPLGKLKELCCTSSVEYQCQFMVLLCRCDGFSTVHVMNMFTTELGEPMTSDVEMQQLMDLQAAMCLACAFEHCASVAVQTPASRYQPRSHPQALGGSAAQASTAASPFTPSMVASRSASSPVATTRLHFRHLSLEEMADKLKK
jgi:hypothetical protein